MGLQQPQLAARRPSRSRGEQLFQPSPADRGQPSTFNPGAHDFVFSVSFPANSTLTWNLTGVATSANSSSSQVCGEQGPPGPPGPRTSGPSRPARPSRPGGSDRLCWRGRSSWPGWSRRQDRSRWQDRPARPSRQERQTWSSGQAWPSRQPARSRQAGPPNRPGYQRDSERYRQVPGQHLPERRRQDPALRHRRGSGGRLKLPKQPAHLDGHRRGPVPARQETS